MARFSSDTALSLDQDDAVRLRVPAAQGITWAEVLAEAAIEALDARSGLAGRLAMILAKAADAALDNGKSDDVGRLELSVAVDADLEQFVASARRVTTAGRRTGERVPATDRLELLADEVELSPGPAGTSVRAKLSLGPTWAEPHEEEPELGISFDGPLFVRALLPRALTALAQLSDGSLRWASELMLLGDEVAAKLVDGPGLETLRVDASTADGSLTLRAWPLADELVPAVTNLLGRDPLGAELELAGSDTDPRHRRLQAALPIARQAATLDT